MADANPVRVGIATAFRRPALVAAEVAWRWSFGAAALALAGVALAGFLDGSVVTDRDLLALGSRNPDLMAAAMSHVLEGAGPRLLRAGVLLIPALSLLWIVAASLGRATTLRALIAGVGELRWRSVVALQSSRSLLGLVTITALLGIMFFAAWISISPDAEGLVQPNETLYLLILLFSWPPVIILWNFLNWLLSLALIFAVGDHATASSSVSRAVHLFREQRGRFVGAAALFGVLRVVLAGGVLIASIFVIAALSAAGFWLTMAGLALLTLGYFILVDFLHVARLSATVEICRPAPPQQLASR